MKLKKKLILIVSLITAVSVLVGGTVLMILMRNSMLRDAYSEAAVSAVEFFSSFERRLEAADQSSQDYSLALIYKNLNNWRNVICHGNKEIYNITVFSREALERVACYEEDETGRHDELTHEDGRYIVNARDVGDYRLYRLYDITDVHIRIRNLILNFVLIAVGILLFTVLVTAFMLRKVMRPLDALTEATNDMAKGDYSRRVYVESKDELGELAVHFNQMAEAVEQKQISLQESEARKTLMMGNLSHELKTPMTAIAGYAETLLTTRLTEEQRNEALYYIYTETNRLGRLSGKMMQLLSLSEGDAVELKELDIREVFHDVSEAVSVKLRERSVSLITEPKSCPEPEDRVPAEQENGHAAADDKKENVILTDEDLIRDVLINLVDNAVKASHPGGRVYLTWKDGELSVRDEGVGIPAEELGAVTEPFYMVDKSRSRKEGGAGLGLSITKLILEKLGAEMKIESQPGVGTVVRILFG